MNDLTAISLFAGAGGDTLGMLLADVNIVGYVEYDKACIATHERNFPDCKLIGKDICSVPDEVVLTYANVIDILFGGFPCQSFSHGGKKDSEDPRGFLYREFVRFVRLIRPKFILGENVKGLLKRKMTDGRLFIDVIMSEFAELGYTIKHNLFNMKNYGIPQSRERVLIYGIRNDLNIDFDLGELSHLPPRFNRDIVEYSLERALLVEKENLLDIIPEEQCVEDLEDVSDPCLTPPTNLVKCYNTDAISFRTRGKPTWSCVVDKDDVARTILCSYGRMPRLFVPVRNGVGVYLRPYTIKELQQIQGFPEDFEILGKYIEQVNQIGNAIPPLFVKHVVNYIKEHM